MRTLRSVPVIAWKSDSTSSRENVFSSAGELHACFPLASMADILSLCHRSQERKARSVPHDRPRHGWLRGSFHNRAGLEANDQEARGHDSEECYQMHLGVFWREGEVFAT